MIELQLEKEECAQLAEILSSYLSDLRMEIADTDRKSFRDGLKEKEAFINKVLKNLGSDN